MNQMGIVATPERTSATGQPLDNHEDRVKHRDTKHKHRACELRASDQSDHPKRIPEEHRPSGAHEDPGRVEVVGDEAQARASEGDWQQGNRFLPEPNADDHQEDRRDCAYPPGKTIHGVKPVHAVHHQHEPDDRCRHGDPCRQRDLPAEWRWRERIGNAAHRDAEHHRDRCAQDLSEELRERAQAPEIVPDCERNKHCDPGHQSGKTNPLAFLARRYQETERNRGNERNVDGMPARAGHARPLDFTRSGVVDQPDRHAPAHGNRRQDTGGRDCDQKGCGQR